MARLETKSQTTNRVEKSDPVARADAWDVSRRATIGRIALRHPVHSLLPLCKIPTPLQQVSHAPLQPPSNRDKDDFDLPPDDHTGDLPDANMHSQNPAVPQSPLTDPATSTATLNIRPSLYNSMVAPTSQPAQLPVVTFADDIGSHMHSRSIQDRTISHRQQPQAPNLPQSRPTQDPRLTQARPPPPQLPANPKLRAAELMRQAAHHTQEATRLNLEAARLIALAPS